VPAWTLTIRSGARVQRERYETLDAALAAMRAHANAIRARGRLGPAQAFREYAPGERVQARLELTAGGWLRRRHGGLDVMGDGALVPYVGAIRKRRLEPGRGEDAFAAIAAALSQARG